MLAHDKSLMRKESILLKLDELGYATRKQLQIICELGGDRNASRILSILEREKAIQSVNRGFKVYSVTYTGKEFIGSPTHTRKGGMEHTLMRNDLYIELGMPSDWKVEAPIQYNEETMRPDAIYSRGGEWHFVEVDNANTMKNNYEKLQRYKKLSKAIFREYNHTPTIIWKTVTENRKRKLEEHMQELGVKGYVFH